MPENARFRCNNCGHRFEKEILNEEEAKEERRKGRPVYAIQCPKCQRTDIRDCWE